MSAAPNPQRLSFARRRRGLSKTALARGIGVSAQAVSDFEAGRYPPSEHTLARIAAHLEFPRSFFFGHELHELAEGGASFRSLRRMTAGQRDAALAAGSLAILLADWIQERFVLPEPAIPDYRELDATGAAEAVRSEWGLGERPLGNVVQLLEAKGVSVFSLAEDCAEVDAYSFWYGDRPFVMLNTRKSSERSRMDACHELGHLVLHRHAGRRVVEEEANAFASAFLMPRSGTIAKATTQPSLRSVVVEKKYWGVSAMAYVYRLHKLGLASDWTYRQLCRRMSSLGYRKSEPDSKARDTSTLLRKVFEQLWTDGVSRTRVAKELSLDPGELERMLFRMLSTDASPKASPNVDAPPKLRAVK